MLSKLPILANLTTENQNTGKNQYILLADLLQLHESAMQCVIGWLRLIGY